MFSWVADHPFACYFFLACAGVGLLAAWWTTRKRSYAIGLGVVAGLAGVVFLVAQFLDTDRKRITRVLQDMAAGVKEKDLDRTFSHIADDCKTHFSRAGGGLPLSKQDLRNLADRANREGGVERIHLWDFDFEELDPPRATLFFNAKPFGKWATGAEFCGCRAQFRQEPDGRWRMVRLELFKPGSTESLDLPF